MLGLSATYNYYLFNGNVDMRKGIFRLREVVQNTMGQNPDDSHNVFIFMSKSRKIVKLLHFERGFYVLYEKRPKNPESYLEDVFRCILFGTKRDKRDFLPCYYQACELQKMSGLEVAKLLSTAA